MHHVELVETFENIEKCFKKNIEVIQYHTTNNSPY